MEKTHTKNPFSIVGWKPLAYFMSLLTAFLICSAEIQATTTPRVKNETTGATFTDLQTAINAASPGDTLKLRGRFVTNLTPFTITKSLTLIGTHDAVLDGNHLTEVLLISETAPNTVIVTLEKLRIINGNVASSGGGINNNANLTLRRVRVENNSAAVLGGGIFNHVDAITGGNSSGHLTIQESRINENTAQTGGGIASSGITSTQNAVLVIQDSGIRRNVATLSGGGVFTTSSTNTIDETEFENNRASDNGGGLFQTQSTSSISRTEFVENTAINGGGIFNDGNADVPALNSSITMSSCCLHRNTATGFGGAIDNFDGGILTITRSAIKHNTANVDGGGIFNAITSTLVITDSEIIHNSPNDISDQ